jgi:PKD repeat protein
MKLPGLILLLFIVITFNVSGAADACHKSTEGVDFWFGFMEGRHHQSEHRTDITLTSLYDCEYDIYIGNVFYSHGIIPKNTPVQIIIPWDKVEAIGSEKIPFEKKAIHLTSTKPINVFALNYSDSSADAALIFPTESLGKEYYTMCYTPSFSMTNQGPNSKNSEFLVVAVVDNTIIDIIPSVVTDGGKPSDTKFSITLSQGEVYQVQSANSQNLTGQGDLTGSYIKSNQPIAVFSGSFSTSIPSGVCCYDHLYEQIPPLQSWGKKFIAVPLKSRYGDTYRILAAVDNTTVKIGNKPPITLNRGEFYEFILLNSEYSLIESNNPILLAQYSNSRDYDSAYTNGDGDPFMVIVSPVNQTREKVSFVAYKSTKIKDKYFLNVVVKDDADGKIFLDTSTPVPFTSLIGTGYKFAQMNIQEGNHTLESTEPGKGFIAYVYGFGGVESYGYGVGFNLDIVLDLGSNLIENGEKIVARCEGTDLLTLDAGNAFDTYKWSTGETTSSIKVKDAKTYSVTASTSLGCTLKDEIRLFVSKPILELGPDLMACNPENAILDAGANDQLNNFLWTTPQTTLTDQKITVTKPGKYAVEAYNKYNCKVSDVINIAFTDKPKLDFSKLETLVCGSFATTLNVTANKEDVTFTINGDPKIISDALNVSVLPVNAGTYPVILTATDKYSCKTDTAFDLSFYKIPNVGYSILSDECSGYNLNVTYVGDAKIDVSNFKWEYDGGILADKIGINSLIVPLGVNKSQRQLSLTVTQNGCFKSYVQNINVTPDLSLIKDFKLGCEPFKTDFSADNTEIVDYFWDFGDGSPIEKSDKFTSHLYQKAGYYDLKLKVTTKDGKCSNEVKIDKMVHVAPIPDVAFSLSPDDCLNPGVNEISYTGKIGTSRDKYFWDFQDLNSANPPMIPGPVRFDLKSKPQANVALKVVSEFGCESVLNNILLKRKPDFSIISDVIAGCIPFEPSLGGKIDINDKVDNVNFSWDFGDNSVGTGASVSHTYDDPDKNYTVSLSGLSTITGCTNLVNNFALRTYPKPTADFSMDHTIVYDDQPTVKFTNSSLGASRYLWDFGDQTTSSETMPSHDYGVMGYQTVLLEVFNEFNCNDTVTHKLLVAFDRIFPPNGFSPNAPDPIDRVFLLNSVGITPGGYHFTVLSRWNDLVFEARDEIKGWDGRMKNGSLAPPGTYLWILNFTDFLGRRHRQTGSVTLVY